MQHSNNRVVLISGPPGVGKSTCIDMVVAALPHFVVDGIVCREVCKNGARDGFSIQTIGNQHSGLLASPEFASSIRFGTLNKNGTPRLGVCHDFLNNVACPYLLNVSTSADLIVIDEIGLMQIASKVFHEALLFILNGPTPVLASISSSNDTLISALRDSSGYPSIQLTKSNRSFISEVLVAYYNAEL